MRNCKVGFAVVLQINKAYNVYIVPINFSVVSKVTNVSKVFYLTDTVSALWLFFSIHIKFIPSHIHHSIKHSFFQFMN